MTVVLKSYPPNYEQVCKHIPAVRKNKNIVFTYAPNIYSPAGIELSPDLKAHEEMHIERQSDQPSSWWTRYLTDIEFRLQEELVAYRAQYRYALEHYNRPKRRKLLSHIASDLSSAMYGNLVTKHEATMLITNQEQ